MAAPVPPCGNLRKRKTPFRKGFRKGVTAVESDASGFYRTTPMPWPPERATWHGMTVVKADRVMYLPGIIRRSRFAVKTDRHIVRSGEALLDHDARLPHPSGREAIELAMTDRRALTD